MPNKIQFKRGLKASLPDLDAGEPGYCTDTQELFIGNSVGANMQVASKAEAKRQFDDRGINVKDYGAVGDGGVTDCSQAFIDAIAACPPGGEVIIPPADNYYYVKYGKIIIDKSITLRGATSSDAQNGGDINACRIAFFANGVEQVGIRITASGVNLKNFHMYSTTPGGGNIAIMADSMLNIAEEKIWISAFDHGHKFDNCIQCYFRQVNVRDCVTGFRFETLGTSMLLEQCWIQSPTRSGYEFINHAYCTLINCLMDGNITNINFQPFNAVLLTGCNTINIVGGGSERTRNSHLKFDTCEDITVSNYFAVEGNTVGASSGHSFAFISGSAKNIVFINPRDHLPAAGTVASITKAYTGTPPIIIGGNLPFGYNDAGTVITVPNGAIIVGMAGIVEDAFYLKASDTGARKKLTVNAANVVTVVNG